MKPIDMTSMVTSGFSSSRFTERCYVSHKPLKMGKGILHGGSAVNSLPGMDLYVGLDHSMRDVRDGWVDPPPLRIHFPIPDQGVPKELTEFKLMVTYLCNQLRKGKIIHIGCIGGHGRTGMLIAAIASEMGISKDPIQWVRDNYCLKAVESKSQVGFLVAHYGAKKAKSRDRGYDFGGGQGALFGHITQPKRYMDTPASDIFESNEPDLPVMPQSIDSMPSPKNIWKEPA